MKRSLWVGAMIAVVLASGCTYTSRQKPSSGATVQDDDAGSVAGTQDESAGGPSAVPAQTGAAEPQAKEPRLSGDALRIAFEQRYEQWQNREAMPRRCDDISQMFGCKEWERLVQLGVAALPLCIEKMPQDAMLGMALHQISGWRTHIIRTGEGPGDWVWTIKEFPDLQGTTGPPDGYTVWLRWWEEGQQGIDKSFRELYARWSKMDTSEKTLLWTTETSLHTGYLSIDGVLHTRLRNDRTETAAGEVYDAIQCLGVAALPEIVETLREGKTDFLPMAVEFTGVLGLGELPKIRDFLTWWEANKQDWLIPWPEVADAP